MKISLDILAVGNEHSKLVGVQTAILKEGHWAFVNEIHIAPASMEMWAALSDAIVAAEAFSQTKCTLTLPWLRKVAEMERPVAMEPPRESMSTLTRLPYWLANIVSTTLWSLSTKSLA